MAAARVNSNLDRQILEFVRKDFHPRFGQAAQDFPSNAKWKKLRELGTELWLDTGSLEEAGELWTREFTALTTNNTLLNKEVQTGRYDELIRQAGKILSGHELGQREQILEIAFILNAYHALRLVDRFDAYVSVEEHTDLANDVQAAVAVGRRYHAICPERFIVKIPLTPAGLLATRRLAHEGVSVNHTLGFSARQNYLVGRIGRPKFVNVFLGRLNSFVADNGLGDGQYVGEKATLASQAVIRQLRKMHNVPSRQIGASFRGGMQICDLAGLDVMTMPPKVAREFLELDQRPQDLVDRSRHQYSPHLKGGVNPKEIRLDTLWDVHDRLLEAVNLLEMQQLDGFTPEDLVAYLQEYNCGDLLVDWTDEQIALSRREGKIPRLENWRELLASGRIGLDSLLNLAGFQSFATDQQAMDDRVRQVLRATPAIR